MNKVVFQALLGLLALGFALSNFKLALILALVKVLLVIYFYMELRHAHHLWKIIVTSLVLITFGGIFLF